MDLPSSSSLTLLYVCTTLFACFFGASVQGLASVANFNSDASLCRQPIKARLPRKHHYHNSLPTPTINPAKRTLRLHAVVLVLSQPVLARVVA